MSKKARPMAGPAAVLIAAGLLFSAPALARTMAARPGATVALENGLAVILRPVPSASSVALVVLFDIGEDQDPAGASGLAHLVEHLYLTAAAGSEKSRNFEDFVARHPLGWNAQTGNRYTALSVVFPPENLEAELSEAAARMKDIRVAAGDLDREKPRVIQELANMYGGIPVLAGLNCGRQVARPSPSGGRKGGRENEVAAITLDQVKDRLSSYYRPANATLVLAGAMSAQNVPPLISRLFTDLPRGKKIPEIPSAKNSPREAGRIRKIAHNKPDAAGLAFLVFAAPQPAEPLYPAFLLLAARLNLKAWRSGGNSSTLHFAPLDDPEILGISTPLRPAEDGKAAINRLRIFVSESLRQPKNPADVAAAKNFYGFFFGFPGFPEAAFSQNLYGLAFSLARRHQLKIDGTRLADALGNVTAEDLSAAARLFGVDNSAAVVVEGR